MCGMERGKSICAGMLLQKVAGEMSREKDFDAHACTHEVARQHVDIMGRLP